MSSEGLYSATSGLPSPASVTSGPTVRRGGLSSNIPLGNTSPVSVSPSTSSVRRESSTNQLFPNSGQVWPSAERQPERMAISSSGSDHNYHRIIPFESKEVRTTQGLVSGPFIEPRISRGRRSPLEGPGRSTRVPASIPSVAPNSSVSSLLPTLSSSNTSLSPSYSPATSDGEKRPALSLPPLATFDPKPNSNGSSYSEPVARSSLQPLASRIPPSFTSDQSLNSPPNPSSLTGMKFESLQLPLPYNISFGQHPLPRPNSDVRLADTLDLQDASPERNLLRDLSLNHEQTGATPKISRDPPQPRHPPHQPNLPSLPSSLRDESHDPIPHNADPLSVLAYAGRIVGREREMPQPP